MLHGLTISLACADASMLAVGGRGRMEGETFMFVSAIVVDTCTMPVAIYPIQIRPAATVAAAAATVAATRL